MPFLHNKTHYSRSEKFKKGWEFISFISLKREKLTINIMARRGRVEVIIRIDGFLKILFLNSGHWICSAVST